MFVNTEQIKLGVISFIENEIASKAEGANKFFTYFIIPIVSNKISHYINAFSENEMTKDMFDENRNLDMDVVYSMAKDAVKKSGPFVVYGIMFNETDIDKLYAHIKKTAG